MHGEILHDGRLRREPVEIHDDARDLLLVLPQRLGDFADEVVGKIPSYDQAGEVSEGEDRCLDALVVAFFDEIGSGVELLSQRFQNFFVDRQDRHLGMFFDGVNQGHVRARGISEAVQFAGGKVVRRLRVVVEDDIPPLSFQFLKVRLVPVIEQNSKQKLRRSAGAQRGETQAHLFFQQRFDAVDAMFFCKVLPDQKVHDLRVHPGQDGDVLDVDR